ncbi:hypothetical protein BGZ74_002132 [Mortierella antarctica]|nr:hypothetical protein BGZ74_002132 [Mortierella antarctica]
MDRHSQNADRPSYTQQPSSHSSPAPSSSSVFQSEADYAVTQQSRRLAGLSIKNSSGAKVSILNDSSSDLAALASPSSPQSPQTPRHYDNPPEPTESQHYSRAHPFPPRYPRDSSHETGRSSSLTNASTPIYSSQELASSSLSQRSRSFSGGANLLSPIVTNDSGPFSSSSASSPTIPFSRSYSEDNSSDEAESYRRMSDPTGSPEGASSGANSIKRKYSCTFQGCNKCFTTSGHLARHNRIHTGERNFACLMPGCTSKFSRQDNMMQHYRTHISPKSRRGIPKKQDYFSLGNGANISQEALMGESEQHYHVAKMSSSRHGSRQNSPPRFNPFERSNSVDYTGRNSTESHNSGGSLRHKNSGIIQTHQHHTPMPHFNVPMAHSHGSGHPSPTPSPMYNHSHMSRQQQHYNAASSYPNEPRSQGFRRSESILASPTSPLTQDVEHMEGVVSISSGPRSHVMGHSHGPRGYQLPPLATYQGQDSCGNKYPSERPGPMAPPSPQSTPHTPTKYRFDPIQDCLQPDKPSREHYTRHDPRFMHPPHHDTHHEPHHYRREEEEETSSTTRSSMSTVSSMTSISSVSSPQPHLPHQKQEDVSGLDHLAQIVTTFG